MAYSHCRTQVRSQIRTQIPNTVVTLYYAEVFTLVSQMVTVLILGTDLHPKDRCLSQFYYISIRGSESKSEPM